MNFSDISKAANGKGHAKYVFSQCFAPGKK